MQTHAQMCMREMGGECVHACHLHKEHQGSKKQRHSHFFLLMWPRQTRLPDGWPSQMRGKRRRHFEGNKNWQTFRQTRSVFYSRAFLCAQRFFPRVCPMEHIHCSYLHLPASHVAVCIGESDNSFMNIRPQDHLSHEPTLVYSWPPRTQHPPPCSLK